MKVHYDAEVDAVYIKLGTQKPDGVVEISEGVNLDTTSENRIVGIEILNASKKMNINTILSYELEIDKKIVPEDSITSRLRGIQQKATAPLRFNVMGKKQ
jgi:uncharacterized protein YuzE